ncbi:MAG: sigma-70 family RNA polymerase sigma factor, partial [Gammaproteobacteria bacterium]|nr:sigma-70 family RNA polymerase sigma factor [Gammaproteobacteria bacterium]
MVERTDPSVWLDEHGDALYKYAFMRVRNEATAEDLVQETLLAAIQAIKTYQGQSSERTWLIGILKHKLMDYFRKAAREIQFEDDEQINELVDAQSYNERG